MHTEVLEIENTLSPSILKKVFKKVFRGTKTGDASPAEIDALPLEIDKYSNVHMGKYIRELGITEREIGENTLKSDYKNKFSDAVLQMAMNDEITWDDIKEHPSAKKITFALYRFLKKYNSTVLDRK